MATLFYGINIGAEDNTVTAQATTTGKDVEVAVNVVANVPSRSDLIVALEKLQVAVIRLPYTPV